MNLLPKIDEAFCGRVPLHQTNLIQPHGYLLIVAKESMRILQASENATSLLNTDLTGIVQSSLNEFISKDDASNLLGRFSETLTGRIPFIFNFPGGQFLATVKMQENYFIVEVEKDPIVPSVRESYLDLYQELKFTTASIDAASSAREACDVAIRHLKKISGFDKAMIYQFDEDWNGDVIAEAMEEDMQSYLGLKFPASDIPRQARELYRKTPFRLIPNIHYQPVKLYPVVNPQTNTLVDLSDSNLRSVAAVHLEYLENMKVMASMSTRILVNGQLWGLIACHHKTPHYLSFEICTLFELVSVALSAKLNTILSADEQSFRESINEQHLAQLEKLYRTNNFSGFDDALLKILSGEGVAIVHQGFIDTFGETPSETDIRDLVLWLQSEAGEGLYVNDHLSASYEPATGFQKAASGLLALPLQPEKKTYILAFRPEEVQQVTWGGNPHTAVQFEPDGKKYHPRASFSLWKQTVSGAARKWNKAELAVAENFRNALLAYMLQLKES